jgi:AcrR family transcriptional regulator
MRSVSRVTGATRQRDVHLDGRVDVHDVDAHEAGVQGVLDAWAAGYLSADEAERRLVDAALACIGRWGVRKTTFDDIAREAGVSRATVYRVFPGGKDRLVEVVIRHAIGRFLHDLDAELTRAATLDDLVTVAVGAVLREVTGNPVLRTLIEDEPGQILPHFAFRQLGRVLDLAGEVCAPYLRRFLPANAVRPAGELLARIVISFAFLRPAWVDAQDPASVRRLVRTYLVPALSPSPSSPGPDRPPSSQEPAGS